MQENPFDEESLVVTVLASSKKIVRPSLDTASSTNSNNNNDEDDGIGTVDDGTTKTKQRGSASSLGDTIHSNNGRGGRQSETALFSSSGQLKQKRAKMDGKVIGMKDGLRASTEKSSTLDQLVAVETKEREAREKATTNTIKIALLTNCATIKVFFFYLITIETYFVATLAGCMTAFFYFQNKDRPDWRLNGLDFVLLSLTVVAPMGASLSMAFARREKALGRIAQFRSFALQIYMTHSTWSRKEARARKEDYFGMEHCDLVLSELIGIGDELCRFLTLPTTTRSRHRLTRCGRREAERTMEVAYRLFDSLYTRRMVRLAVLVDSLQLAGLEKADSGRILTFERSMGETIEALRHLKMYRTPQALRSFARLFSTILPMFYTSTFAHLAIGVNSLPLGIAMAVMTTVALTALYESIRVLEDPFTGFIVLDGVDVREELEVLHWQQLVNARGMIFPLAEPFPDSASRAISELEPLSSIEDDSDRFLKVGAYAPPEEKDDGDGDDDDNAVNKAEEGKNATATTTTTSSALLETSEMKELKSQSLQEESAADDDDDDDDDKEEDKEDGNVDLHRKETSSSRSRKFSKGTDPSVAPQRHRSTLTTIANSRRRLPSYALVAGLHNDNSSNGMDNDDDHHHNNGEPCSSSSSSSHQSGPQGSRPSRRFRRRPPPRSRMSWAAYRGGPTTTTTTTTATSMSVDDFPSAVSDNYNVGSRHDSRIPRTRSRAPSRVIAGFMLP